MLPTYILKIIRDDLFKGYVPRKISEIPKRKPLPKISPEFTYIIINPF